LPENFRLSPCAAAKVAWGLGLRDRLARNIFFRDWAANNGFAANLFELNKTNFTVLVDLASRARFQVTDFIDFEVPMLKPVLKTEFVLSHG
jgi:hypothetical protein